MFPRLKLALMIASDFGLGWMVRRAWVSVREKLGVDAIRCPKGAWQAEPLKGRLVDSALCWPTAFAAHWQENGVRGFVPAHDQKAYQAVIDRLGGADLKARILADAERILNGEVQFFSNEWRNLGSPINWHSGEWAKCRSLHWSRIPTLSEGMDIKELWDPARFGFAWTLVRAYAVTGDERYPEYFWRTVESWRGSNPPNTGPQWRCGQETSLRIMAWIFALHAFRLSHATTPERLAQIVEMIAVQACRVAATVDYSRLQDNNHSISEGMGLYIAAAAFPELAGAAKWRRTGKRILEDEALRLISPDGSFSQHSCNYHRLMLHDYIIAIRLGQAVGDTFDWHVLDRLRAAGEFLRKLTDPVSGWAPNTGGNDGALVMPLDSCDYNDMRPVCAAAHMLLSGGRLYENGIWSESLYWLFGKDALDVALADASPAEELRATDGGFYTLRGDNGWAMLRCGSFKTRPAHADSLHVDLWWKGRNICADAGTYKYNAPAPWNKAFVGTASHNTVEIAGQDQLVRGPHFMWLNWHSARLLFSIRQKGLSYLEGEHDGYMRLATPSLHRRALLQTPDGWLILDDVIGTGEQSGVIRWLLPNLPLVSSDPSNPVFDLGGGETLSITIGIVSDDAAVRRVEPEIIRAERDGTRGWISRRYGEKTAAVCLSAGFHAIQPLRISTRIRIISANTSGSPADALQFSLNNLGFSPMILSARFADKELTTK